MERFKTHQPLTPDLLKQLGQEFPHTAGHLRFTLSPDGKAKAKIIGSDFTGERDSGYVQVRTTHNDEQGTEVGLSYDEFAHLANGGAFYRRREYKTSPQGLVLTRGEMNVVQQQGEVRRGQHVDFAFDQTTSELRFARVKANLTDNSIDTPSYNASLEVHLHPGSDESIMRLSERSSDQPLKVEIMKGLSSGNFALDEENSNGRYIKRRDGEIAVGTSKKGLLFADTNFYLGQDEGSFYFRIEHSRTTGTALTFPKVPSINHALDKLVGPWKDSFPPVPFHLRPITKVVNR